MTHDAVALEKLNVNSPRQHMLTRLQDPSPWESIPDFTLYLRFTSGPRFEKEYHDDLIRTMKLFYPKERAKLLVVLDDEKEADHKLGEKLHAEWPFPQICYRKPGDPRIYYGWGKARMFWDMMYPDACTNVEYVGYVDTDTFFSTIVTPQLFFENNKPIIVAKIGQAPYICWEDSTEIFLRKKAVMQCMSTFPVMVKTAHMKQMREFFEKDRGKPFDEVFRESAKGGKAECICQFSFICNYLWYYHRDEYSWRLQMQPDGNWKGEDRFESQVTPEYYEKEVTPEMRVPIPRSSVHLRYTIRNGKRYISKEPEQNIVEDFVKEGLCYSAGFDYCPEQCKRWNRTNIHYNLYSFEFYQWFWDKRCKEEQDKHYANVKQIINYYIKENKEVFNLPSIQQLCTLL